MMKSDRGDTCGSSKKSRGTGHTSRFSCLCGKTPAFPRNREKQRKDQTREDFTLFVYPELHRRILLSSIISEIISFLDTLDHFGKKGKKVTHLIFLALNQTIAAFGISGK